MTTQNLIRQLNLHAAKACYTTTPHPLLTESIPLTNEAASRLAELLAQNEWLKKLLTNRTYVSTPNSTAD